MSERSLADSLITTKGIEKSVVNGASTTWTPRRIVGVFANERLLRLQEGNVPALVLVRVGAAAVPAIRGSRVDPMAVLRAE